jgi:homoserine dehydrogenase
VVTANKALLAAAGPELLAQAARHGRRILTSPSVGGGTPVLEAIARVGVQRLRGVLNGTANYVLERCRHGDRLEAAIDAARAIGLAEADPSRDLDGTDSLDKLKVIALLHDLPVTSMDTSAADVRRVRGAGRLRQVATLDLEGTLRVAVEPVHPDDPLHDLPDAWNAVEIVTAAGETLVVRGKGAGRWPTAESVVADLLALARGDAAEWTASACPVAEVR